MYYGTEREDHRAGAVISPIIITIFSPLIILFILLCFQQETLLRQEEGIGLTLSNVHIHKSPRKAVTRLHVVSRVYIGLVSLLSLDFDRESDSKDQGTPLGSRE